MDVARNTKLRFERPAELFAILQPDAAARAVADVAHSTEAFVLALEKAGLLVDAIRYAALALPRRESVWWACAVRKAFPTEAALTKEELAAWSAVSQWVYNPCEETRTPTYALAEALGFETSGAYAALAAFWADGNLAPEESGVHVPPGEGLTASMVAASVILLCASGAPEDIAARQRLALKSARDIAAGGNGKIDESPR